MVIQQIIPVWGSHLINRHDMVPDLKVSHAPAKPFSILLPQLCCLLEQIIKVIQSLSNFPYWYSSTKFFCQCQSFFNGLLTKKTKQRWGDQQCISINKVSFITTSCYGNEVPTFINHGSSYSVTCTELCYVLLYEAIGDEYMTLLHRVTTSDHHDSRNLELYSVKYLGNCRACHCCW